MAELRWNPVSVNFNDASALMRNAGDSISKAGTVFGELRKSILDEEQRAIENAYKEKVFAENMRQFNERLGFDKSKWGDEKILKELEQKETHRHNEATERNQAESNAIHRLSVNNAQNQWKAAYEMQMAPIRAMQSMIRDQSLDQQEDQAWNAAKKQAVGSNILERTQAEQEFEQVRKNIDNGTLTPEQYEGAINRAFDLNQIIQKNIGVEKQWEQANPHPPVRITDNTNLGLHNTLAMRTALAGGVPLDYKSTPWGQMYSTGLAAQQAATEQKNKLALERVKKAIDFEQTQWKEENKPLSDYLRGMKLNENYDRHATEAIAQIRKIAAKRGIHLTSKQAAEAYKQAFDVRPELVGESTSPEGFGSLFNLYSTLGMGPGYFDPNADLDKPINRRETLLKQYLDDLLLSKRKGG